MSDDKKKKELIDKLDADDVLPYTDFSEKVENQNRKAQGLPPLEKPKKKKKKKPGTTSLMGGGKIGKPIKYAVGGPTKPAWMRNR